MPAFPPTTTTVREFAASGSTQPLDKSLRLNAATAVAPNWVRRFLRGYGAIVGFLLAWQLASQLSLVDPSVIPSITQVAAAIVQGFADGGLASNLMVSLGRSGIAFGAAVALAIPLGLFMGSFRRFEELVDPLLQLFRQTSALAIYPIFILLLGLGETSKIAIIFWAAFFPMLLSVRILIG